MIDLRPYRPDSEPIQMIYVLLNGSLEMSPGKAAAQTAHAIASLHKYKGIDEFSQSVKRTVIVLEAKDQQQLDNLHNYLYQLDVPCATYTDEGVNEITPYSVTALAIGPIQSDNWEVRSIFSSFELYGKIKKQTWIKRVWKAITNK